VELPLPGSSLDLGDSLAEAGAVQGLDLLGAELLPVSLLLGAQSVDLVGGLTEAHGGQRVVHAIRVAGGAVPAVAHDLPLADLVQCVDGGHAAHLGTLGQLRGQLAEHSTVE